MDHIIHQDQMHSTIPPPGRSYPTVTGSDWRDPTYLETVPPPLHPLQMPTYSLHQSHHGESSPSHFASPTDSSPTSSPYPPPPPSRHQPFSLVLAQNTPVGMVDSMHASHQEMPGSYGTIAPPPFHPMVPHGPRPYLQSPPSHYTIPAPMQGYGQYATAGVGLYQRPPHMLAAPYPYQAVVSPVQDSPVTGYGTVVEAHESQQTVGEPASGGHFTPSHQEAGWARQDQYTAYSSAPYSHGRAQPQLLLAHDMPTRTPIEIDDPFLSSSNRTIVRHEDPYEASSHAATNMPPINAYEGSNTPFVHNSTTILTPIHHTATHQTGVYASGQGLPTPVGGYPNRTDMDIYANQTTTHNGGPFSAQPIDGPLPLVHGTAQPSNESTTQLGTQSLTVSQGHDANDTGFETTSPVQTGIVTEEACDSVNGGVLSAARTGQGNQYAQKQEERIDEQSRHLSPHVSDAPVRSTSNLNRGELSSESGKAFDSTKEERRHSNGFTQKSEVADSSAHEHDTANARANQSELHRGDHRDGAYAGAEGGSRTRSPRSANEDVAVASLPHSNGLSQNRERYLASDEDSASESRVNGTARTVDSPTNSVDNANTTGSTIKPGSPDVRSSQPPTRLHIEPKQEAGSITDGAITTSPDHSPDIDRSYSLPLQPNPPHPAPRDMQAIANHPYQQSSTVNSYSLPSVYTFQSRSQSYGSSYPPAPSQLRPASWDQNSYNEYPSTFRHNQSVEVPRHSSISTEHGPTARSLSPVSQHRHSLPNIVYDAENVPPTLHTSPPLVAGYSTPGGKLGPAVFDNSHNSGSSASSTPPTVHLDGPPSYKYDESPTPRPSFPAALPTPYGFSREETATRDTAYQSYPSQTSGYGQPPRGHDTPYYSHDYAYGAPGTHYTRPYDSRTRGSSSPAPPMIAGSKRGREDEWYTDDRDAQRRRASYTEGDQMGNMYYPGHSVAPSPQLGVMRPSYPPSPLKELRIGVVDSYVSPVDRMPRRPGDSANGGYSFISLPGNAVRKRPRRKFEEITRNYLCNWPGCSKAYGTLNHLNAHVTMQKHGPKRTPAEFKELRKQWRKEKREQQQRDAIRKSNGEVFLDDDRDDTADDDKSSVYGGHVEIMQ